MIYQKSLQWFFELTRLNANSLVFMCARSNIRVLVRGKKVLVQIGDITVADFEELVNMHIELGNKEYDAQHTRFTITDRVTTLKLEHDDFNALFKAPVMLTHQRLSAGQFICAFTRCTSKEERDHFNSHLSFFKGTVTSPIKDNNKSDDHQQTKDVPNYNNLDDFTRQASIAHRKMMLEIGDEALCLSQHQKATFHEFELRREPLSNFKDYTPFFGFIAFHQNEE